MRTRRRIPRRHPPPNPDDPDGAIRPCRPVAGPGGGAPAPDHPRGPATGWRSPPVPEPERAYNHISPTSPRFPCCGSFRCALPLTFVLAFHDAAHPRWASLCPPCSDGCAVSTPRLRVAPSPHLAAFFLTALVCHQELSRLRPAHGPTDFYLGCRSGRVGASTLCPKFHSPADTAGPGLAFCAADRTPGTAARPVLPMAIGRCALLADWPLLGSVDSLRRASFSDPAALPRRSGEPLPFGYAPRSAPGGFLAAPDPGAVRPPQLLRPHRVLLNQATTTAAIRTAPGMQSLDPAREREPLAHNPTARGQLFASFEGPPKAAIAAWPGLGPCFRNGTAVDVLGDQSRSAAHRARRRLFHVHPRLPATGADRAGRCAPHPRKGNGPVRLDPLDASARTQFPSTDHEERSPVSGKLRQRRPAFHISNHHIALPGSALARTRSRPSCSGTSRHPRTGPPVDCRPCGWPAGRTPRPGATTSRTSSARSSGAIRRAEK